MYFYPLGQGFPTGGTRTPKGYEIEHQGVRRSLGHRAAYISLIEQYISQNFFGGTKNALTWQRGTSSKKGWEPLRLKGWFNPLCLLRSIPISRSHTSWTLKMHKQQTCVAYKWAYSLCRHLRLRSGVISKKLCATHWNHHFTAMKNRTTSNSVQTWVLLAVT